MWQECARAYTGIILHLFMDIMAWHSGLIQSSAKSLGAFVLTWVGFATGYLGGLEDSQLTLVVLHWYQ